MSINELQAMVKHIYRNVNQKNGYDFDYFFGYLTRTIASAFKRVRYGVDASEKFAKCIAYLFSISELCNMSLQDHFLQRFPKVCPYCLTSPCECYITKKTSALSIPQRKYSDEKSWKYSELIQSINSKEIDVDLDYAVMMLHGVYPLNEIYWIICKGPEYHISKCLEELGEVHEAYSLYLSVNDGEAYISQVQDELCDLFAWVLSSWRLCCKNLNLTKYFMKMFNNRCPSCNRSECICEVRHVSSDMLWRKAEIEYIYQLLKKLITDESTSKIVENKFNEAIGESSNSGYKRFVKDVLQLLNEKLVGRADKRVEDLYSAIEKWQIKI